MMIRPTPAIASAEPPDHRARTERVLPCRRRLKASLTVIGKYAVADLAVVSKPLLQR